MMFHLLADVSHQGYEDEQNASEIWFSAMQAGDFDAAGRGFTQLWGGGQPWERIPEAQRAYLRSCMPMVQAAGPEVMGHPDGQITLDALARLSMPVLLLSGTTTRHTATAICEVVTAHTDFTWKSVEGAGHMLPISHPSETATLIASHIGDAEESAQKKRPMQHGAP
jgi:pimeloyl-ACP methyl ester carboxylesterase